MSPVRPAKGSEQLWNATLVRDRLDGHGSGPKTHLDRQDAAGLAALQEGSLESRSKLRWEVRTPVAALEEEASRIERELERRFRSIFGPESYALEVRRRRGSVRSLKLVATRGRFAGTVVVTARTLGGGYRGELSAGIVQVRGDARLRSWLRPIAELKSSWGSWFLLGLALATGIFAHELVALGIVVLVFVLLERLDARRHRAVLLEDRERWCRFALESSVSRANASEAS